MGCDGMQWESSYLLRDVRYETRVRPADLTVGVGVTVALGPKPFAMRIPQLTAVHERCTGVDEARGSVDDAASDQVILIISVLPQSQRETRKKNKILRI